MHVTSPAVDRVNRYTRHELYAVDDAPVQCTGTLEITISVYMQYVHVIRYANAQTVHYGSFEQKKVTEVPCCPLMGPNECCFKHINCILMCQSVLQQECSLSHPLSISDMGVQLEAI